MNVVVLLRAIPRRFSSFTSDCSKVTVNDVESVTGTTAAPANRSDVLPVAVVDDCKVMADVLNDDALTVSLKTIVSVNKSMLMSNETTLGTTVSATNPATPAAKPDVSGRAAIALLNMSTAAPTPKERKVFEALVARVD
jgi:hypothetical protein